MQRLDDQNFEYQKHIKRQTPAFASIRRDQSLFEIRGEHLTIYNPGKGFKLIAKPAQTSKPLFNIKESRLLHYPSTPSP
ncbi:hypothetical protein HK12_10020 [Acetobacter orientalis]|uniref:Uncharacterized protein n=1 Tax=Acetobacter orientalis TaxID=146474 RepID=A0A251ZZJ8_9PROT|nr:hypothetical protein HK12_10020 [Acetobacter orientalis]